MKVILYTAFIALMLLGCGSRKSNVDLFKQSEKTNEGSKEKSEETNKTEATKETNEVKQKDKTEEVVTTKVEESLNPDGSVNKRTTTTKTEKRKDNSQTTKKGSETSKTFDYKTFSKTYWKEITIRVKEKHKQVEVSNVIIYVILGVIGCFAMLMTFLYIKTRNKLTEASKEIVQGMF